MMKKTSDKKLSIMVPAYNEEENLKNTISEILEGIKGSLSDYEILIFNDGSTDSTQKVAQQIVKKNRKVKLLHNKKNRGMGYCYKKALLIAKFPYFMYIPGDNQFPKEALSKMLKNLGEFDIIIPYVTNMHIRHWSRKSLSYTFTFLINLLFNLNIKYYNGTVIHKSEFVKRALPNSNGHAYQAEILVNLLKDGRSYTEVGYKMVERRAGLTSAFTAKNIKSVILAVLILFWKIQVAGKYSNKSTK